MQILILASVLDTQAPFWIYCLHWQETWTLRFVLKNYDQKLPLNSSVDKNCKIQFAFTQSSPKEWKKLAYFAYSYIQTRW